MSLSTEYSPVLSVLREVGTTDTLISLDLPNRYKPTSIVLSPVFDSLGLPPPSNGLCYRLVFLDLTVALMEGGEPTVDMAD